MISENEKSDFNEFDALLFEADMCLFFEMSLHSDRSQEENEKNAMKRFKEARE
jgi:hypothetical protein